MKRIGVHYKKYSDDEKLRFCLDYIESNEQDVQIHSIEEIAKANDVPRSTLAHWLKKWLLIEHDELYEKFNHIAYMNRKFGSKMGGMHKKKKEEVQNENN